jgi:hypothetical protein
MKKELMTLAQEIATKTKSSKVDKYGMPSIEHATAVAERVHNVNEKVVALLHDAYEEGVVSLDELRQDGYPHKIIAALEAITQHGDESYNDYINHTKSNKLARSVKIADLMFSGDLSRIKNPTGKDFSRSEEYAKMIADLNTAKNTKNLDSPFEGKTGTTGFQAMV